MQTQDTQDASAEFLFKLWPWLEENAKGLIIGVVAVIVVVGGYFFIQTQHEQSEINAGEALTMLMANPPAGGPEVSAAALTQLATKYAGSQAAERAQLQGASLYYSTGDYAKAQAEFEKFLSVNTGGPQAAIAQLGLATSLEAQGKLDVAVPAYQKVVTGFPSSPSVTPANYALGRIFEAQGKLNDALSYYSTLSGPEAGSYGQLAKQAEMRIQAKMPAQKPVAPMNAAPAATAPASAHPATTVIPSLTPVSK